MQLTTFLCCFLFISLACSQSTDKCGGCKPDEKCNDNTMKCERCSSCFNHYKDRLKVFRENIIFYFDHIIMKYGDVGKELDQLLNTLKIAQQNKDTLNSEIEKEKSNVKTINKEVSKIKLALYDLQRQSLPEIQSILSEAHRIAQLPVDTNFADVEHIQEIYNYLYQLYNKMNQTITSPNSVESLLDLPLSSELNLINFDDILNKETEKCILNDDIKSLFTEIAKLKPKGIEGLLKNITIINKTTTELLDNTKTAVDKEIKYRDVITKMKKLLELYEKIEELLKLLSEITYDDNNLKREIKNQLDIMEHRKKEIRDKYKNGFEELDKLLLELEEYRKRDYKSIDIINEIETMTTILEENVNNINEACKTI